MITKAWRAAERVKARPLCTPVVHAPLGGQQQSERVERNRTMMPLGPHDAIKN